MSGRFSSFWTDRLEPPPLQLLTPLPSPTVAKARRSGRKAVFVDKDGALVGKTPGRAGTEGDPERLDFVPGALAALAALSAAGHALVILATHSELSRGGFARAQFAQHQAALLRRLHQEAGVVPLDFVVCPHPPGPGGRPACLCRKPAPGLLLRAARVHDLDLAATWMVGDSVQDVEAGRRAGCRTVFLDRGGAEELQPAGPLREPHLRCTHWDEVTARILRPAESAAASASS